MKQKLLFKKNSFKGTLEEYKSKKKEKKIIKRVIRSNSNSPRETEYENDDALSECSTDTSFSEQENISDEIVSFSLSELSKEITNDCNIDVKIPKELKSTIRSLLVSKIKTFNRRNKSFKFNMSIKLIT